MSSRNALVALGLSATLGMSCREINSVYCGRHPEDIDCPRDASVDGSADSSIDGEIQQDGAIDSGIVTTSCTSNTQCTHPTPVCDISSSMCVSCTATQLGACSGTAPVCGANNTCRGCAGDADCASMTCLPDGSCAAVGSVLYAAPPPAGGPVAGCTPDAMCTLLRAVELVDEARSIIRLAAGRYELASSLALGTSVRIVGRDAEILRDAGGTGAALLVTDGTTVALDYLTVSGGDGEITGHGIGCSAATLIGREISVLGNAAAGINSVGCALTLVHARISANQGAGITVAGGNAVVARSQVIANQSGGVAVNGASFDLRNNVIAKNGGPTSAFGGVLVSQITMRGSHVFEFNTVAHNQATAGSTPGVICSVVVTPLSFGNSIVFGNAAGIQVAGDQCAWSFSDIGPVAAVGTGNVSSDPQFIAPAQNNFHLPVSSPLRDAADPAATLADDIDGETRPQGGRRDMGADEIN